jgi:hypothetical protein
MDVFASHNSDLGTSRFPAWPEAFRVDSSSAGMNGVAACVEDMRIRNGRAPLHPPEAGWPAVFDMDEVGRGIGGGGSAG